jgi:oligoendopeptidase F
MDRRGFLETTGLGLVATVMGSATAAAQEAAGDKNGNIAKKTTVAADVKKLPPRSEVNPADTWDLSSLFADDDAWEKAFVAWQKKVEGYAAFRGELGDSAEQLAACMKFNLDISREAERLGVYAGLKVTEDRTNGASQRRQGRFEKAASEAGQASSFIQPEILALPSEKIEAYLQSPALAPYELLLTRIVRFKPHTLSDKEERLLAMQAEVSGSSSQIFRQLNDGDIRFGAMDDGRGHQVELSHGTYMAMLISQNPEVRRNAFHQYYSQYKAHEHTLAATLNASMQQDLYGAKVRNYKSSLEAAMFPDNVPVVVYDNLIASIRGQLPSLYRYYELRRRKMGLKEIHQYDTYAPIVAPQKTHYEWNDAVAMIVEALRPLGDEYCSVLQAGLMDRWCDRYENRGKQSGAFSSGSYDGKPYILLNYQSDVLDHVFTIAHEGGHSMHSYYSAHNQPFAYYDYSLFVAEVASTFNETMLSRHLVKNAKDKLHRAFILNHEIDSIRSTIFRQVMFAEFEKNAHASAEAGEPLTLERFKEIYHKLLADYFGPDVKLDADLDLECFRVPHFYRAFYVYKYATSMSAAIALVDRVLNGGQKELNDYLGLLKGGCSKDPLDLLRGAGVDMEKPGCVDGALARFGKLVEELDSLI